MIKPVLIKKDFVKRFMEGEFGNRGPVYSVDEWLDLYSLGKTVGKLYHLRNRIPGGETYYNQHKTQIAGRLYGWGRHRDWREQERDENWYIAEMAPTEHTLIQGEVMRTERGLYLRSSTVKKPMRDALASSQDHTWGLKALETLRYYMDGSSFDWLQYLLDEYEDHVIEFSTYGVNWGTLPYLNSVIWEVRSY